MTRCLINISI